VAWREEGGRRPPPSLPEGRRRASAKPKLTEKLTNLDAKNLELKN
jgi:hypothetical protein